MTLAKVLGGLSNAGGMCQAGRSWQQTVPWNSPPSPSFCSLQCLYITCSCVWSYMCLLFSPKSLYSATWPSPHEEFHRFFCRSASLYQLPKRSQRYINTQYALSNADFVSQLPTVAAEMKRLEKKNKEVSFGIGSGVGAHVRSALAMASVIVTEQNVMTLSCGGGRWLPRSQ